MMGLNTYEGKIRMTTSKEILDQLDLSQINKPGLKKIESKEDVWDDLHYQKLDKYQLTQNVFLEYHGGESEDEVTIIPMSAKMNFFIGFRPGMTSINGPTQEITWKWDVPVQLKVYDCQIIKGEN